MCQILAVTSKQSVNNWRERSVESISRLPTPPVDFMWIWLRVNTFRADWALTISISELIGTESEAWGISCCNIEQVYWTLISHLCFSVDQTLRSWVQIMNRSFPSQRTRTAPPHQSNRWVGAGEGVEIWNSLSSWEAQQKSSCPRSAHQHVLI